MYDDLARAQRPSALEWLVVNALIPSVLVTFVLQWPHDPTPVRIQGRFVMVCDCGMGVDEGPGPIPDVFPRLISMPKAVYPDVLRRAGVEDHVVLRALVNTRGRVDSTSILIVQATNRALALSARRALIHALFWPARFDGKPIAGWTTMGIDFTLTREAT